MRLDTIDLTPPPDWEAHTSLLLREPSHGGFRMNIQVKTQPSREGLRLQVLGITQAKTLERDLQQAQIKAQGLEEIAGREVYVLDYTFAIEQSEMAQLQFFTLIDDRLISMTGTALTGQHDALRQFMETVLGTLKPA